jgi:outer membrane lipoprotein-sorting protein
MSGVLIRDAQGNKNRFDFTGATQPASFPPDEFVFAPPPGTNVTKN